MNNANFDCTRCGTFCNNLVPGVFSWDYTTKKTNLHVHLCPACTKLALTAMVIGITEGGMFPFIMTKLIRYGVITNS